MSSVLLSPEKKVAPREWSRAPAVPIAVAVAAGIVTDAFVDLDWRIWLILTAVACCGWLLAFLKLRTRQGVVWLLISCGALGAGWHHLHWSVVPQNHIAAFAPDSPQLVRLRGRVCDRPWVVPKKDHGTHSAIPQYDHTQCTLECQALIAGDESMPVAGLARLDVTGHLLQVHAGDEIELVGRFSRPGGQRNPGGFDFRRYLRNSGIHATVHCGEPDGVRVVRSSIDWWTHLRHRLRNECEFVLRNQLSEKTEPVGTALLLGTRTAMSEKLRSDFAESGTTHILAISGANVAILAGLLWFCCRLFGVGRIGCAVVVLVGILGYACVADAQPPVLRAVVMLTVVIGGTPWHRRAPVMNYLAIAALGVLACNPLHLFDIGAQLSFLAVAAMIWSGSWWTPWHSAGVRSIEVESAYLHPAVMRALRWAASHVTQAVVMLTAIWFFTIPLTLGRFHLFSAIGLPANLILAPLMVVVMWCGYALLLLGLLLPPLSTPLAVAFDAGLRALIAIVEWSAAVPRGHIYLPGPGNGWLCGFYICLMLIVVAKAGTSLRRNAWKMMLVWIAAGLAWSYFPKRTDELRCTFLAVGHGVAVLLELPGGKTLLYDAGQLQDASRGQQIVQSALWDRGHTAIDAMVLSHADIDHFNAVPGLTRTVGMHSVVMHPSFLDFRQPPVEALCETLSARKVPIRLAWAGDKLLLDDAVALEVLHPSVRSRSKLDNANSLVLSVEYAGRTILLTGDLEADGLSDLLRQPRRQIDLMLSPHHGSLRANPVELARWGEPKWVVVSGGRSDPARKLDAVYGPGGRVLHTRENGAVTFTIDKQGTLHCECFLKSPNLGTGDEM